MSDSLHTKKLGDLAEIFTGSFYPYRFTSPTERAHLIIQPEHLSHGIIDLQNQNNKDLIGHTSNRSPLPYILWLVVPVCRPNDSDRAGIRMRAIRGKDAGRNG